MCGNMCERCGGSPPKNMRSAFSHTHTLADKNQISRFSTTLGRSYPGPKTKKKKRRKKQIKQTNKQRSLFVFWTSLRRSRFLAGGIISRSVARIGRDSQWNYACAFNQTATIMGSLCWAEPLSAGGPLSMRLAPPVARRRNGLHVAPVDFTRSPLIKKRFYFDGAKVLKALTLGSNTTVFFFLRCSF